MTDPASLLSIVFSDEALTQRTLVTIAALVVPIAILVLGPPSVRLLRLFLLERRLRDTADEYEAKGPAAQRSAMREWLRDSALEPQFEEFERRWNAAQLVEGGDRAPIRLLDVLEDRPLLPFGPRRSLLPALPGLFLGIGVLGAIAGLIPGLALIGASADAIPVAAEGASPAVASDPLALQLGLALRATAAGFAAAIAAHLFGRLIEGGFEARSRGLDEVLARAHRAVSPGELAEIGRQTQQRALETLGRELTQFAHELNERLERGLQRIEQSSSRAASLVSQEQRGALHAVVQELSLTVRQGVEHHLAELRTALQRTVDYQSTVTNGLSEGFERMAENAAVQDRVARTLAESATALDAATRSLASERRTLDLAFAPGGDASAVGSSGTGPDAEPLRARDAFAEQIAAELGQALRGFTEQVQQIDRTLAALGRELQDGAHDLGAPAAERPALQPGGASAEADSSAAAGSHATASSTDAASSTGAAPPAARPADAGAADAAEKGAAGEAKAPDPARAERGFKPGERAWAAAPADRASEGVARERTRAPSTGPSLPARTGPPAPPRFPSAPSGAAASETQPPAAAAAGASRATGAAGATDTADGPLGRELSLSGFRVGTPRALGPDPYERLAQGGAPPSNVRPFPARDRELGDDLKLSGLLGPSGPRRREEPSRRWSSSPADEQTAPERESRSGASASDADEGE